MLPSVTDEASTNTMGASRSGEEIKAEIRARVTQIVRSRTGPSFEERIEKSARRMRKQTDEIEIEQRRAIHAAVERGRLHPCSSPSRVREPESAESRAKRGIKEVNHKTKEYWQQVEDLKRKMAEREPLYKLEEVAAAVEELKERQVARKRELTELEQQRWSMISALQEKVLERPLVMDEYERKPMSQAELQKIATPAPQPMGIDRKVKRAIESKQYQESPWAAKVEEIKARQTSRPKLHELKYGKYVRPEIPQREPVLGPLERSLRDTIEKPWFKNSDWAATVQDLQEKQINREKLHEITYPPRKHVEPEPVQPPSAFMLKIQADMADRCERGRVKMVEEERKQRQILNSIKKAAMENRDRGAIGLA